MAVRFTLELDEAGKRYLDRARNLLTADGIRGALLRTFDRQASVIAGKISRNLQASGLQRRTGSLARSIAGRGELFSGVPGLRVGALRGPALKYVDVQERGTVGKGGELPTIVPVKGKALAIPVDDNLTAAGVPRIRQPSDMPRNALHFVPFRRSGIGKGAIGALYDEAEYQKEAARARGTKRGKQYIDLRRVSRLFLLIRKTDIKPKRFLRNGLEAELPGLAAAVAKTARDLVLAREGAT